MAQHPLDAALKEALAAVRHARDTRSFHGRRTKKGSPQREHDLKQARERLRLAMIPLRSFLGEAPYKQQTTAHIELHERVRKASAAIQSERRKLWKMMTREQEKELA